MPCSPTPPDAPSNLAAGRRLSRHGYSISIGASKQRGLNRDRASSRPSGSRRLPRRLQVQSTPGTPTLTLTLTLTLAPALTLT